MAAASPYLLLVSTTMANAVVDDDAFVPGVFVIFGHLSPLLSTVSRLLYFKFQNNVSQHLSTKDPKYDILYRKIIFSSKIEKEYLISSSHQRLEKTFLDMRHERINYHCYRALKNSVDLISLHYHLVNKLFFMFLNSLL